MHVVLYLKDLTGMICGFQIGYLTAWSIILDSAVKEDENGAGTQKPQ